jgi:hypothetical protein
MASILVFFKQGKIFLATQINGNNFKILSNRQPFKTIFEFTRYFFRCPQCSAAAEGSEEF